MAEIPNVIPGEPIETNWGNEIRDRTLQRYQDITQRDLLIPIPIAGDLAYIIDDAQIQYYDGIEWLTIPDNRGMPGGFATQPSPFSKVLASSPTTMFEFGPYPPGDGVSFLLGYQADLVGIGATAASDEGVLSIVKNGSISVGVQSAAGAETAPEWSIGLSVFQLETFTATTTIQMRAARTGSNGTISIQGASAFVYALDNLVPSQAF